jgi:hypothetical protein
MRHVPSQVTSQLPTDWQNTSLASPTRGVQLLTLLHSYWQFAPQVAAQLLTWSQATLQRSPHVVRQLGPSWHPTTQSSTQVDRHRVSKLEQSSSQGPGPQLWSQAYPGAQHRLPEQLCDSHPAEKMPASATAASVTARAIRIRTPE